MASEALDRLATVRRFPDQSHIGLSLEDRRDSFA
jgi:hypothetical protein